MQRARKQTLDDDDEDDDDVMMNNNNTGVTYSLQRVTNMLAVPSTKGLTKLLPYEMEIGDKQNKKFTIIASQKHILL